MALKFAEISSRPKGKDDYPLYPASLIRSILDWGQSLTSYQHGFSISCC